MALFGANSAKISGTGLNKTARDMYSYSHIYKHIYICIYCIL